MAADPEPEGERLRRLAAVGARLRVDVAAAAAVTALLAADVDVRLLKGASLARWLDAAGPPPRAYLDVDLLVDPARRAAAEAVLERLGYRRHYDDRQMPGWWREAGVEWVRADGVTVDLHRTIAGVGVSDAVAWERLAADPEWLTVADTPVPVLALPARALHVALHAAHHGRAGHPHSRADLRRALALGPPELWRAALALADRLGAREGLAAGLGLEADGAVLAARLGLQPPRRPAVRLAAGAPPPGALGFSAWAEAPGWRSRAAMAAAKLVPPPAFMRRWEPRAVGSRRWLVLAYLRRPVWIAARAPAGWWAWRRARGPG